MSQDPNDKLIQILMEKHLASASRPDPAKPVHNELNYTDENDLWDRALGPIRAPIDGKYKVGDKIVDAKAGDVIWEKGMKK